VGIATRTSTKSPGTWLIENLDRNIRYRDRLTADGAFVLEGLLVERGTKPEEKQVDVLCEIAVADIADRILRGTSNAKCIVVLSE
ncbi:hypothetical protein, partial [Klebsiella pneumoniae]|uniref:hypothetical protein n=1 Tax=Klebsiella pneumoniae TaxID=573 RepID=UPI0013D2D143